MGLTDIDHLQKMRRDFEWERISGEAMPILDRECAGVREKGILVYIVASDSCKSGAVSIRLGPAPIILSQGQS